jgi:hypothetical protein
MSEGRSAFQPATIERLDSAITLTAYVMQRHSLPQLLPTLKRLEAARDELLVNGDALEYAARVLARSAIDVHQIERHISPSALETLREAKESEREIINQLVADFREAA